MGLLPQEQPCVPDMTMPSEPMTSAPPARRRRDMTTRDAMRPKTASTPMRPESLAMSRKKVIIVKKLKAIQNFGAMNVLCTDKTGTLTQDRIVLERYVDVTNRPSEDVLRYAYMNSYYQTGLRTFSTRRSLATKTSTWSARAARWTNCPSTSCANACRW